MKAEWELAKSLTSESKHVPEQRNVSLPGGSYTWHKNWPNCSSRRIKSEDCGGHLLGSEVTTVKVLGA